MPLPILQLACVHLVTQVSLFRAALPSPPVVLTQSVQLTRHALSVCAATLVLPHPALRVHCVRLKHTALYVSVPMATLATQRWGVSGVAVIVMLSALVGMYARQGHVWIHARIVVKGHYAK